MSHSCQLCKYLLQNNIALIQIQNSEVQLISHNGIQYSKEMCCHLVVINSHWAITLVVLGSGSVRTVDRDLGVVGSQAVTVSVVVGEEATLQHLVWGRLNARHKIGRGEGQLFHLLPRQTYILFIHHCGLISPHFYVQSFPPSPKSKEGKMLI